ncbi:MAG TPA: hypothetical protein VGB30_13915, partial [bacterium]
MPITDEEVLTGLMLFSRIESWPVDMKKLESGEIGQKGMPPRNRYAIYFLVPAAIIGIFLISLVAPAGMLLVPAVIYPLFGLVSGLFESAGKLSHVRGRCIDRGHIHEGQIR